MKYKKIGFVIADDSEFAPVERHCESAGGKTFTRFSKKYCEFSQNGRSFIAVLCETGKVNAAAATAIMIAKDEPDCIINFGLSGAVSNVHKHDITLGKSFIEYDFDLTPLGYKIGQKPQKKYKYEPSDELCEMIIKSNPDFKIIPSNFVTGDRFVTEESLRKLIIDNFDGNCCDMESAAIASVCSECGVPFASVRYLSDGANDDACDSYRAVNEIEDDTLLKIVINSFC